MEETSHDRPPLLEEVLRTVGEVKDRLLFDLLDEATNAGELFELLAHRRSPSRAGSAFFQSLVLVAAVSIKAVMATASAGISVEAI